jgi:CheY-like chemotaxis protein
MTDKAPASSAIGETVLVVEDEVLLRLVVAEYLRDCSFKVIEAAHADEAVMVLKQPDLRIDVLFSDIEMPGMDASQSPRS